ncbi:MAG: hypothetical protein U1F37_10085 [Alphaproteobacteria bacterium]
MRLRILALLALAALALPSAPAAAQTQTGNALREWGLLGWWSLRCDLPVSQSNFYYGYVVDADGRAWHERDLGNPSQNDRSEVTVAEIKPDGTIAITVDFKSIGSVRTIVFMRDGNRMRAMHNRGSGGDVTVENGIFKHNGQPTPWQSKCRGAS